MNWYTDKQETSRILCLLPVVRTLSGKKHDTFILGTTATRSTETHTQPWLLSGLFRFDRYAVGGDAHSALIVIRVIQVWPLRGRWRCTLCPDCYQGYSGLTATRSVKMHTQPWLLSGLFRFDRYAVGGDAHSALIAIRVIQVWPLRGRWVIRIVHS